MGYSSEFLHGNLGYLSSDDIVEVSISTAANVCLLDSSSFNDYVNGRSFRYYGGHFSTSPCRIPVPYSGNWNIVIDLGGESGYIGYSVQIIKNSTTQNGGIRYTSISKPSNNQIENIKWQIQDDNPDCLVKVRSDWLAEHPKYGLDPNTERTDFLVFDKRSGNLHKHFSIGEDTNWELKEWHDWKKSWWEK